METRKKHEERSRLKQKENIVFENLFNEMDEASKKTFTPKQLKALKKAIKVRQWRTHTIDIRPTLALPFVPWSFYAVFLLGVNKRNVSPSEKFIATGIFLFILFIMGLSFIAVIFLFLYLIKSWLGVDIFQHSSLGIWDEFKRLFE